ncbi:MATE family efflux transporter [Photobacterium sanguinicancri]|uniref:MATE family efflux transporter n=1 Tax=Photobacterium sanguinicancri TaxID=875932 RepID=UPI002480C026|nr:MATE family efflux transporter [Photobacterium sanguinicancri]
MNVELVQQHVPKAILKFAVPSIIAMILTSAISIIDGYFIGNYIGESALTAVNLGLPIIYLFLAVGIMVGVGGVSQASRLLGAKKIEQSVSVFNQTAMTGFIALLTLALLLLVSINPICSILDVDEIVKAYFVDYYSLMILVYPFAMLNVILGMFVRAEGKPVISMILSVISVVLNTTLDYLLVTHFDYGVKGIAIASIISVMVGVLYMLSYFKLKARVFKYHQFTFSRNVILNTFKNGSSEFIGQLSMCITTVALNYIIMREGGVSGVAAFTVVGYSTYLFTMIVIGFGQGSSPLISFANGAKEHTLAKKVRNHTTMYVFILGLLSMLALLINADRYSLVFVDNEFVGNIVRSGIPIYSMAFLFMGTNIIASFYFTCIGNAKTSAIISGARGLVILLACIFILPSIWGMQGVWFIAPVTEMLTVFISFLFLFNNDKLLVTSLVQN